ncbi:hypothetical protein [Photobacterium nomapromontoriensis]|uniref:hypothetical protein n=1 Tax=Photobacterium nomapromontoriensis TaxID=2910237 RepID=UPI003D130B21
MMEYDFKSHPLLQLTQAIQPDAIVKQFQTVMMAGKALESITVASTKQAIEQSYQQSLKLLEEMDKQFYSQRSKQEALCFPFDVMDQFTRNVSEQWKTLAGYTASAAADLTAELEQQKLTVKELNTQVEALEAAAIDSQHSLTLARTESEKFNKAKLAAQRNTRKVKSDLEATAEQIAKLEEQVKALTANVEQRQDEKEKMAVKLEQQRNENEKIEAKNVALSKELSMLQSNLASSPGQEQQQKA